MVCYDDVIMNCIKTKFKSAKQISIETEINVSRVSVRLNSLNRHNMVLTMQGNSTTGTKPKLYKAK